MQLNLGLSTLTILVLRQEKKNANNVHILLKDNSVFVTCIFPREAKRQRNRGPFSKLPLDAFF